MGTRLRQPRGTALNRQVKPTKHQGWHISPENPTTKSDKMKKLIWRNQNFLYKIQDRHSTRRCSDHTRLVRRIFHDNREQRRGTELGWPVRRIRNEWWPVTEHDASFNGLQRPRNTNLFRFSVEMFYHKKIWRKELVPTIIKAIYPATSWCMCTCCVTYLLYNSSPI